MCLDPLSRQCPKYIAQSIQNHCDIMKELAESNATLDDSRSDLMTSNKNTIINYRKFRNSVGCKKSYIESKYFNGSVGIGAPPTPNPLTNTRLQVDFLGKFDSV